MIQRPQPTTPQPGQESVWDYPRPPRVEPTSKRIRIRFHGRDLADSLRAMRVLETSHPPVYYIPPDDIDQSMLRPGQGQSFCEWKGQAKYVTVEVDGVSAENVGWFYPNPAPGFEAIRDYIAFYAEPMESCTVAGEEVVPQPGRFYGGWITSDVVGPFKGVAGSTGW